MSNTHYQMPAQPQQTQPPKKKVPMALKVTAGIVGGIVLLGIFGSTLSDDQPEAAQPPAVTVTATAEAPSPTPTPEAEKSPEKEAKTEEPKPEKTEPEFTREEENAIQSARDYLDYSAFSRSGLIEQLEFEGYPKKTAEKAVDYLDVDWMEQAVKCAEDYLDYSSFSKQGLIDQLIFEGFTEKQARHGAEKALG